MALDVLPRWYRDSVGAELGLLTICPCQSGPTGWCRQGRHEKCGFSQGKVPEPHWETHIIGRDGGAYGVAPVWRVGRACRWMCPCRCHAEVMALIPPVERRPGKASRTGGNQAAATDAALAVDDAPTLFDLAGA